MMIFYRHFSEVYFDPNCLSQNQCNGSVYTNW